MGLYEFTQSILKCIANRTNHGFKLIVDRERRLGNFELQPSLIPTNLNKEKISRQHILGREGVGMNFLDVGARDGDLTYLLGIRGALEFDQAFYNKNKDQFDRKYNYYGMDLDPAENSRVISGDACDPNYMHQHGSFKGFFDIIYSNNVFEHFKYPWIAASNLSQMLKPGGLVVTIVPFSQRYHECPGDFFRYTHTGIQALFSLTGQFEVLESGYDIQGRRINWQGMGNANDIVPVDNFGAWRETWFVISVMKKMV